MKNKTKIVVYKNAQRIAAYHYKQGHAGRLLDGIKTFYAAVYPSATLTYSVNTEVQHVQ